MGDPQAANRLLVIDAGNSRCKIAIGDADAAEEFPDDSIESMPIDEIESFIAGLSGVRICVVSSVNSKATKRIEKGLSSALADSAPVFLSNLNSPIALNVQNPDSLGSDRIAAAIGAYGRFNSQTIVIDSGTATTIDFVDDHGVFQGGAIFPGFQLALDSLASHTDRLPQTFRDWSDEPPLLGRDTVSAMQSGVFWSQVATAELFVSKLQQEHGPANILITGGNGQHIFKAISMEKAILAPALVLEGLWRFGLQKIQL